MSLELLSKYGNFSIGAIRAGNSWYIDIRYQVCL